MVLMMDIPNDLMPLADAAREYSEEKLGPIGIKYWTLRSWIKSGKLRSWKQAGEIIFVSRAEVEQLIRPKPIKRDDTATEG